ncbi:MAG: transposase [Elusimicrobiota bacterium]
MINVTRYAVYKLDYYFLCIPNVLIPEDLQSQVVTVLKSVGITVGINILTVNILSDGFFHIIFSQTDLNKSLVRIINSFKGVSSRLLRKILPRFRWYKGYFICSLGEQKVSNIYRIFKKPITV